MGMGVVRWGGCYGGREYRKDRWNCVALGVLCKPSTMETGIYEGDPSEGVMGDLA